MSLTQTRPKDLVAYDPDAEGAPDVTELEFVVDHSTFAKPKSFSQMAMSSLLGHIEKDRLTNLSSASVSVVFGSAFSSVPTGEVRVYRMDPMDGGYIRQMVNWVFDDINQPSTTGFNLTINSSESLTGVVLEYNFQ